MLLGTETGMVSLLVCCTGTWTTSWCGAKPTSCPTCWRTHASDHDPGELDHRGVGGERGHSAAKGAEVLVVAG